MRDGESERLGAESTASLPRSERACRRTTAVPFLSELPECGFGDSCHVGCMESVDAFVFDCEGVIWKGGDQLIDGVSETLHFLRSKSFVTNNSTKSRSQYAAKFLCLGISVSQDEIFSSSFAAAIYLKSIQFPSQNKVYVIGCEGILEELHLAGFTPLGGPEDANKTVELKENRFFLQDKTVGAVVAGLDQYISLYKLQYATLCIRENPGCLFIATNRDAVGNMTSLQEWPGAGCMIVLGYYLFN
ncbi:phosphoglycolate phosphatase 2-like [Silene latifolia]|uniref:phosphoglycolate phosphatase 2-like n=1 Tax=Silene latifolia TaxID=37657 RepID=UPI003D772B56